MAGVELKGAPRFWVGSTVNAGAMGRSTEIELEEMTKKADAGAQFFITPPLFELEAIKSFMSRIDERKIKIIPTVLLLKSVGMARYMARNVENVFIPDDLITRLQKAGDKVRECVRIAAETVAAVRQAKFGGVLIATLGWEHKLPEIIQMV
jgi:5,10-methylenetetrahydrofolate reductase